MVRIIRNEFEKNLVLTQWNISLKDIWVELDEFNVGLELRQQVIADSLGFIPKDDPETYIVILIRPGWDGSTALVPPEE